MDKAQDVDEEDGEASGMDCETITFNYAALWDRNPQ